MCKCLCEDRMVLVASTDLFVESSCVYIYREILYCIVANLAARYGRVYGTIRRVEELNLMCVISLIRK